MPNFANEEVADLQRSVLPVFLARRLGDPRATLPRIRTRSFRASVGNSGLTVTAGRTTLSLLADARLAGQWRRHEHGLTRETAYGRETVTLERDSAEQLQTVVRHQGKRTWRWRLQTGGLTPRLHADGSVRFGSAAGLQVLPVTVFDGSGSDVTPAGAHWLLRRTAGSWWLVLRLDDAKLPLPYTIDPSISAVSVTASSLAAGAYANWTANFTTSSTGALAAGGTITVTFPTWTGGAIPANPPVVLLSPSGFAASCTATATTATATVTITLVNASGQTCALGNSAATSLKLLGITNTTSTGNKTISVKTSKDTTAVNATATIAAAAAPTAVSFAGSPQTAAALSSWTVGFTSTATGALVGGSTITAAFNSSFAVPAAPAVTLGSQFASCSATATASAQTVTVTLANSAGPGSCLLPASTATTVRLAGLTNPAAGSYANTGFTLKTRSNTTAASPSAAVVIAAATSVSGVSFAGSPQTGSARASWTVGFTSSNTAGAALAAGAKVTVVFPTGFTIPATPTVTPPGGFSACAASGSTSSQTVTITLADSGGSCSLPINTAASVRIAGITNPVAGSYVKTGFTVKTSTDTAVASPAANVVIAAATSPSSVGIGFSTRAAGASTTVTPSFSSSATGALGAGDTITVRLPTGSVVPASPTTTLTGGFSGCTASGSGASNVATITLAGGSCALANQTQGTLTIAGATNPPAGTYANTTLSIATSTDTVAANPSSGVVIFGPATQLAFTTQPTGATEGVAFPTQPVVTVLDSGGRTVADNSSQVTLAITAGSGSAGAALTCTSNPLGALSGVASFSGCRISPGGTGYTLTASDGSLTPATSTSFNIATLPPQNTALPALSGTTTAGQTLSSTNGSWTGNPTSFTYQWRRCDAAGSTCVDIAGATTTSYLLTIADVGMTVRMAVTASNAGGPTTASSNPSAVVAPAPPTNTALPTISGTTTEGQTLTAANGSWTGSPTGYVYQWRRCDSAGANCLDIGGATAGSYLLASADAAKTLRVVVTASNAGGSTAATSAATAVVTPLPPQNTTPPAISGTAVEGQTLSVSTGSWSGSPTGYAYKWRRCDSAGANCNDISGATATSYALVGADVGNTIRVVVTATNAGGATSAASAASSVITASQSSYRPAVLFDNPVGYWRLAESSGTTITDGLGGGHNGSYAGAVTLAEASPITADGTDYAAFFNGGWGSIPHYSALNPTGDKLTMEFWWKGSAPGSARFALLKGYTSHNDPYYQYGIGGDASGGVRVVVDTSGSFNPWDSGIAWPGDGNWHQVAVTYDGSLGSNNLKLYLDSVLRAQTNRTGNVRGYATPLGLMDILNLGAGYQTSGRLDDVAIYNSALSSTRINAHYTAATQPTPQQPANIAPPTVSGIPLEGESLSSDTGAWTGAPAGFTYQWRRCDTAGANCADIVGATSSSHTAVAADVGSTLRAAVTATNAVGSMTAVSAATGIVADRLPHIVSGAPPQAGGFTSAGDTLQAATGTWTGSPTSFTYQWRRCDSSGANCADLANAIDNRYLLHAADVGHRFIVKVVAHNDAGTGEAFSFASDAITAGAPATATAPSPSASDIVGDQHFSGYHWRWRQAGYSPFLPSGGWVFELEGGNGQDNAGFYHCLWIGNPLYSNTCDDQALRDDAFKLVQRYGAGLTQTSATNCSPFPAYPMPCFASFVRPVGMAASSQWGTCGGGHTVCTANMIADPVNGATGNFVNSVSDLSLPSVGVPLELARTYNSGDHESGPLGRGWSLNLGPKVSFPDSFHYIVQTEDGARLYYNRGSSSGAAGTRSLLTEDAGEFVLVRPDQVSYRFAADGRVLSEKDRNGQGLTFAYTGSKLTGVTDSRGRTTALGYNAAGLLSSVQAPDGRSLSYGYTDGRLTSVTDVLGHDTTYTYDTDGNLLTEVDPNGHTVVTNIYGDDGRVVTQADALGKTTTFSWDPATETETVTDPRLHDWKDVYSSNVLAEQIDPQQHSTDYGHDADLNQTSVEGPTGATTAMTYDERGNVLTATAPPSLGSVTKTFAYNASNDAATVTDARGKVTTYGYDSGGNNTSVVQDGQTVAETTYNAAGEITSSTDGNNHTTTNTYDANANLASSTDPLGNTTTYTYDAAGRMLTKVDPRGNILGANPADFTTTYTYDAAGHQLSETDPLGHTRSSTYDSVGNKSSSTDARGYTTTYAYDAANHLTSTTGPDPDGVGPLVAPVTTYTYDDAGNQLAVTDPLGHTTSNTYDIANRLASVTTPKGEMTRNTYDVNGNLASVVDPRGNEPGADPDNYRTTYTYDAAGRQLTETDPLGHTTAHVYDAVGNEASVTDGNGHTATKSYDGQNRLTSVTAPDGGVTTYAYDSAGNQLSKTDPLTHQTTGAYDVDNRLISTTTPLGHETTYTYDAAGNQITRRDPLEHVTTSTYDAANRLLQQNDPLGHATTYTYDPAGNRLTVTDANEQETASAYDPLGRLVSLTAPDGGITSYTYDAAGNKLTRADANGHTTTYAYDEDNRESSMTAPMGRTWTTTYDAAGNKASVTDANGNATPASGDGRTAYAYDAQNQQTGVAYSDSTPGASFSYDGAGNRTSMIDGAGTSTYAYDTANRLTGVTRGADTFAYTYDQAGEVTSRTYPDQTLVTDTYDADSHLASVTSGGKTTNYGYDAAGQLVQTTLPSGNGYVETRVYDAAGRVVEVDSMKGSSALSNFAYTLDPVGNPTRVARTGTIDETTTYGYDANDRLTSACYQESCPGASDPFVRWTYDQVGNRLTETRPPGTTSYTYDAGDELTQAGPVAYTYDENGSELSAGARTFSYDLVNRLISTTSGSATTSYTYDADGNRLQTASGPLPSQITNYIWDTNNPLPQLALERDGSAILVRRYLYGVRRIALNDGSGNFYYGYDSLGSVANVTSPAGESEWTYTYDPFGEARAVTQNDPSAPANPMQFTGEYLDSSGLYYLRAREYDPTIGRFTATDPVSDQGWNGYQSTYEYAADRPSVMIDPSGKTFQPSDAAKAAASFVQVPADPGGSSNECQAKPFDTHKSYCSRPWIAKNLYEGHWNYACYIHDTCYGSCLTRRVCDDCFVHMMRSQCRKHYWVGDPRRYSCVVAAEAWYKAVRRFGNSRYNPHCGKYKRGKIVLRECPN